MVGRLVGFALAQQRHVNTHVVSPAQRVLELDVLNICLLFLDSVGVAKIHQLLDGGDVLVVMIRRVVAKHVHVEPRTLLDHRQTDPPCTNDRDGFACDLVAEKRQERMPRWPLLIAHQALALPHLAREHAHHEKTELGRRFGEHVGRVGERDFVFVRVGAADVIEPDCDLGHDLECPLPGFENFGIDRIAQRRDQPVDAALHFLDDQFFRRRLGTLKNFERVTLLAQSVLRRIADARSGKDSFHF